MLRLPAIEFSGVKVILVNFAGLKTWKPRGYDCSILNPSEVMVVKMNPLNTLPLKGFLICFTVKLRVVPFDCAVSPEIVS